MHSVLRQLHTVEAVGGIGRDGTDHVRRVDILDSSCLTRLAEVLLDLILHEVANLGELLIPAGVRLRGRAHELLSRALGNDHDGVPLLLDPASYVREASVWAVEDDGNLRDKAQVDVPAPEGCVSCDEACRSAHQLDDANAVGSVARGLGLGTSDRVLGGLDGGGEAKGTIDVIYIVVDSLQICVFVREERMALGQWQKCMDAHWHYLRC